MNSHQNKIALVTGATRGIGAETVRQLAQAGVHTLLAGRKRETAVEQALKLQAEGLPVEAIQLDVTDAASIAEAVEQVRQRHGRLDILVNNAGIMIENPAQAPSEQSLDTWKRTFDTNVYALVAVTQAFLPLVRQAKSGRIVNVSSMLGSQTLHADPTSGIYDFKIPAYNASKAAVNSW
ncbi:TPA: SDR family NAD(P)-dependent oxidoreductase, partial [Stenotrophomonas maltophilia]|nr:SDR family NAD(P)-dependent oxidoreductase [Stenotrophomonas maltophilia]